MPQTIWEITLLSFFIREAYDLGLFTVGGFTLKHFNALRFNSGRMQEDGTWQPNYASTIKIFHSFKYFRLWKLVKVGFPSVENLQSVVKMSDICGKMKFLLGSHQKGCIASPPSEAYALQIAHVLFRFQMPASFPI